MSQLTRVTALLAALETDIVDAWGAMPVNFGPERQPVRDLPRAEVRLPNVPYSPGGMQMVRQKYTFEIRGRFDWPSTGNLVLLQTTKANLLIAQLITGATYAGCTQPLIEDVRFDEDDDPQQQSYDVIVTFSCMADESHH
jgi:hypothetical protein